MLQAPAANANAPAPRGESPAARAFLRVRASILCTVSDPLPYRLACLCDLRDDAGRVLLLRRAKAPNLGLCSPIGGKLDMERGESPAECAQREIREEAGLDVPLERLHLLGLITERAYEGRGHWLLFYYRLRGAVAVRPQVMREGTLEWHREEDLEALPLPQTDRRIIWPLVRRHEGNASQQPGFFAVHIDCSRGEDQMTWAVHHSIPPR